MKARYDFVKSYVRRRDAAVLSAVSDGDIKPLKKLIVETTGKLPTNEKVIWLTAHKMCCNITTIEKNQWGLKP